MCKQKFFDVDETRKIWLMKEAGKLHRNFRTSLTNKYLRDHSGNIRWEPPPLYSGFITKEDWGIFVRKRTEDPEFLVSTIIY